MSDRVWIALLVLILATGFGTLGYAVGVARERERWIRRARVAFSSTRKEVR